MTELGLGEVKNPSLYFVQTTPENRIGVCPGVIMEGNRLIIVELQALTTRTFFPLPRRVAEGISKTRLEVLTAILAKYTKYDLSDRDVYVNIAGGLHAQEAMLDLPAALAIISSHSGIPLPENMVAFGEITLTGQIRISKRAGQIEKECKRLGYKTFQQLNPTIHSVSQLFLLFKTSSKK
jgi:DNA repair protein RadA/Sms